MYRSSARYMLVTALAALSIVACSASEHAVGNSLWSIPPSNDYYSNWSSNRTFLVGDYLGLSDVTQVSRREYEACSAENPFKRIVIGPATVGLSEQGMLYFICSFGNYCRLGQKVSVPVQPAPK